MTTTAVQDRRKEILEGDLFKLMVWLSVPAILAMSINAIQSFVDGLFVGQFVGQNALAGISLALPLTMITNGVTAMIGVGASSALSLAIGAKDFGTQKKMFGVVAILSIIGGLALFIFGYTFAHELIGFMGGTGEIQELGVEYYEIMMIGALIRVFAFASNNLVRAEGKLKEAMILLSIGTILNIFLNPIFIVYLDMGVAGAAWATVVAALVICLLQLRYFLKGKATFPIDFSYFKFEKSVMKPVLQVGISAMMLQIMFFVQQAFVFKSLAHYGDDWHLAFMGACYRVLILLLLPSFGFSQAFQPIVGINYGAGKYDRVKRSFNVFAISGTVMIIILWAFIMLFPTYVLSWMLPEATFSPDDLSNFRWMLATVPCYPLFFLGLTHLQSIGDGKRSGYLLIGRELLLYVPVLLIAPLFFGVNGIYYAGVPNNIIVTVIVLWIMRKEYKKMTALEEAKLKSDS